MSQIVVSRLDVVRLRMWGEKLNLLSRLSVVERGLLLCTSMNRGIVKFRNAKLVRQLRQIMARLEDLISCARMIRVLARRSRKRSHPKRNPTELLTGIMEEKGYVPGDYALGDAGLRGEALSIYRGLKHGSMPLLAKALWSW